MKLQSRFLCGILSAIMALSIFSASAINISGRAVDALDKQGLAGATIKLLKANRDSSLVKGATTNADGYFQLTNVNNGKYVVSVSYIGYKNHNINVTVSKDSKNRRLGEIALEPSSIMLDEAVVVGVKTEVVVKEDTVEYNADSYRTQPNAVVEDLLKEVC